MKVIEGSGEVPVIYTAHHASHEYGEFESRVALTPEQKVRFSDYGTDETVPLNGIVTIVAERSRALGDLNRNPYDPGRFQEQDYSKPDRHNVWKDGEGLTDENKEYCQQNFYEPFQREIASQLAVRSDLTFVVAWDNTAHYEIGNDNAGNPVVMKPFILSNRGFEGSSHAGNVEQVSCDPEFLEQLIKHLEVELEKRQLPNDIHLNLVMRGGYICDQYSTLRHQANLYGLGINCEVQSLQVEYDTIITHDQDTLEPRPEKIRALREAFSRAIETTYVDYTQEAE